MTILKIVYIYFIIINFISFMIYGIDKYKATKNKYRIPELTLLLTTILGGFIGSAFSMILFKHKLSKKYFIITIIISFILYVLLLGFYIF